MTTTRTDPHRPGAIIPADYRYECSYGLPGTDAERDPGYMDDFRRLQKTLEGQPGAWFEHPSWGHPVGTCSVCGATFRFGDVWQHVPTGQHVHVGYECARKYQLLADREKFLVWRKADRQMRAAAIKERRHAKAREIALTHAAQIRAGNPELDAALRLGEEYYAAASRVDDGDQSFWPGGNRHSQAHSILADMARKLVRFGSLTDNQVGFALKLAADIRERAARPAEAHAPCPRGRVTFSGTVVSIKEHVSDFGVVLKMTVKVEQPATLTAPAGSWLAWVTVPSALAINKGDSISLAATMTPSDRDAHFGFGKRPSVKLVNGAKPVDRWAQPAAQVQQ